jgi:RNA polymerase II subunit A small phosphatase-like protein
MSGKHQPPAGNAVYSDDHLLPPQSEKKKGKKCLVLDLDETLVHSSFKLVPCDFVVPVKIEDKTYKVYVAKRPHVDEFMRRCGELYEIVVFTASLAQYADPVIDLLDIHKVVDWRLFRESCTPFKGAYVKDMGRMGRDITQIMILDNSSHSYLFNRENAIPCETWYNDKNDRELEDIMPLLEKLAEPSVTDVRKELRELGISPLEPTEDELYSETGEYESGSETGSMEDSDFTGSSEYTQDDSPT